MLSVRHEQEIEEGKRSLLRDDSSSSPSSSSSLVKQLVDVEILYLLTFNPKSGYEIRKQLLSWFKINVSYGTLYPHLHTLEKSGLISGAWEQKFESAPLKKRMYSLTPTGREFLKDNVESLTKISLTMQFMITRVNMGWRLPTVAEENKRALDSAERFLVSRGYVVKKASLIKGYSGYEYPVELFANKPAFKSSNLVLRIAEAGSAVTMDDILKTHVMSFDLEASKSIILSSSSVSDEVRKLTDFYHISIYAGKDLESAALNMCSSFEA